MVITIGTYINQLVEFEKFKNTTFSQKNYQFFIQGFKNNLIL